MSLFESEIRRMFEVSLLTGKVRSRPTDWNVISPAEKIQMCIEISSWNCILYFYHMWKRFCECSWLNVFALHTIFPLQGNHSPAHKYHIKLNNLKSRIVLYTIQQTFDICVKMEETVGIIPSLSHSSATAVQMFELMSNIEIALLQRNCSGWDMRFS